MVDDPSALVWGSDLQEATAITGTWQLASGLHWRWYLYWAVLYAERC